MALAAPSLFGIYQRPPKLDGALVIGISQSGQSPDIVNVIAEAQRQNAPTIAITNDVALMRQPPFEILLIIGKGVGTQPFSGFVLQEA